MELFKTQLIIWASNSPHKEKLLKDEIFKEYERNPGRFYGEVPCICYKLNYVLPCNKFNEIKNLILRIKEGTGLRSEFRGIVAINIEEWHHHEDEEYFIVFLKYLHDHSDYIQYIFYSEEDNLSHFRKLVQVAIQYMTLSMIQMDENLDLSQLYIALIHDFERYNKIIEDVDVKYLTDALLSKHVDLYNESIKDSIILDMIDYIDDEIIDKDMICQYINDETRLANMIGG
ncbi:MAG: hypothetical protein LUG46_07000 [Erysipelotrichaceae bacterium]|nr:hypothetical protein [Erysipelotrichaceae bacterium]